MVNIISKKILSLLFCSIGQLINAKIKNNYSEEMEGEEKEDTKELFVRMKQLKFLDINEWTDILDMLDKTDDNMEFPFILFIAVNLADYNNVDLNYQQISEDINGVMANLVYKKDSKIGRKILVVVCPISSTIEWKDYFLSQFSDIPTGFPLFILTCRIKNCAFCSRNRAVARRLMSYCGISIPLEEWYKSLYYKNDIFNVKKAKTPYTNNKIGIITAILNHGFYKEGENNLEDNE